MKRRTTTIFLAVLAVQPGVRVDGAGGWSVCELSKPVESEAKHALERFTSSLPPALFRERYVDQRPALLSGEAVPPQNDPAQYWSRSGMLASFGSQSIQVISVPKKAPDGLTGEKVPEAELKATTDPNANKGVRGKPVTMAISAFVDDYLGCPHRPAYWTHTRPYVFSGARALLRLLEYRPPLIMSQTRPSKEFAASMVRNSSTAVSRAGGAGAGAGGAHFVYIEYLSMGGVGTGLKYHRHQEAWTEVMYGRKLWLLHEPKCTMEQIWPDVAPQCPKGRCEVFYGVPPASHTGDGLVLDTYLNTILPKLPDRGTTNNTCLEKPQVVIQNAGEVLYLPARWWHFTYNLDDTVGVTMHVLTKVKPQYSADSGGGGGVGAGELSGAELLQRAKANFKGKRRNSMNYFTTTPGLPSHGPAPANNRVVVEERVPYSERRQPRTGPGGNSDYASKGKPGRSHIAP